MDRFDRIVSLWGMPRSGTTIIARILANHTRVKAIIEPFQRRRESQYAQSSVEKLCGDFDVQEQSGCSLLVKETTTRLANIQNLSALMEQSAREGRRVGCIYVVRSPLEAFLSQVDATERLWETKSGFGKKEVSVRNFWISYSKSLRLLRAQARDVQSRCIIFDRFVDSAEREMALLMTMFGYPLEPGQLLLARADPKFGGDPRAQMTTLPISRNEEQFRAQEVAELGELLGELPEYRRMRDMHDFVKAAATNPPVTGAFLRELARLTQPIRSQAGSTAAGLG